jgi:hypothetical protein
MQRALRTCISQLIMTLAVPAIITVMTSSYGLPSAFAATTPGVVADEMSWYV